MIKPHNKTEYKTMKMKDETFDAVLIALDYMSENGINQLCNDLLDMFPNDSRRIENAREVYLEGINSND
jgi:hypothetical protein